MRLWNTRSGDGWRRKQRILRRNPKDAVLAARLRKSVDLIPMLPFPVTLWDVQNICYPALVNAFEEKGRGVGGDPAMQHHFDNLVHLAEQLRIRAPQLELKP